MLVRIVLMAILLGFPLLEALVLLRLSATLGWWVLAWVVLAACAGMALIKEARFAMLAQLAAGFAQGRFQITALTDSARTVLAGLLLGTFPAVERRDGRKNIHARGQSELDHRPGEIESGLGVG